MPFRPLCGPATRTADRDPHPTLTCWVPLGCSNRRNHESLGCGQRPSYPRASRASSPRELIPVLAKRLPRWKSTVRGLEQLRCRLTVGQPAGDEPGDLQLPRGEGDAGRSIPFPGGLTGGPQLCPARCAHGAAPRSSNVCSTVRNCSRASTRRRNRRRKSPRARCLRARSKADPHQPDNAAPTGKLFSCAGGILPRGQQSPAVGDDRSSVGRVDGIGEAFQVGHPTDGGVALTGSNCDVQPVVGGQPGQGALGHLLEVMQCGRRPPAAR